MASSARLGVCLVVAGLVCALVPTAAYSGFINAYSGNTRGKGLASSGIDGTFHFAVIDLTTDPALKQQIASFAFVQGDGSPALDLDRHYLYVYQAVNDGNNATVIDDVSIGLNGEPLDRLTSWGYFAGISLKDAQGAAGDNTLPSDPAGRRNAFGSDLAAFTEVAPANVGVTDPGFSSVTGLRAPALVYPEDQGSVTVFKAYFAPIRNAPTTPYRSVVFGYTTDDAPAFDIVNFQDGGGQAMGTVVAPVPEPATLALILTMTPIVWVMSRSRRRRGR